MTYNPQNHVEVLLDLIGQKSRPRLRSAVRSQSDIRWLCHGSVYRKTSCTASGYKLPPHKRRLTHAKSIWWQLIDIVNMISTIMFDMSTHNFACRQEHYISYLGFCSPEEDNWAMEQPDLLPILYCQYHAYWCSDDFMSHGISRHGIDLQSQNIPSPAPEQLIFISVK